MENTITINLENLTTDEREQLQALLAKNTNACVTNSVGRWKPQANERYYFVKSTGAIDDDTTNAWNNNVIDCNRIAIGNCFKSVKDAEFAREKQRVAVELQDYANVHNDYLDWSDEHACKYYLYYDYDSASILYDYTEFAKIKTVFFTSKEIAQRAIETIGEDRLKKYYFEVV